MKLLDMNDRLRVISTRWLDHLLKKNTDYCPSGEGFENAKLVSDITGVSVPAVLFVNMQKHWSAVGSFLQRGNVETEDILDRLGDISSYCQMMAVWIENERTVEEEPDLSCVVCGHLYSVHGDPDIGSREEGQCCLYEYPDAPRSLSPGAMCACTGYISPEPGISSDISLSLADD